MERLLLLLFPLNAEEKGREINYLVGYSILNKYICFINFLESIFCFHRCFLDPANMKFLSFLVIILKVINLWMGV